MERYCIAIDGGGTKTEALLIAETGRVLATLCVGGSNPNDLGVVRAIEVLVGAVSELVAPFDVEDARLFAGIAGAGNHREALLSGLSSAFPSFTVSVGTDAAILLSSGLAPNEDGACIISGTGSVCYARRSGVITRIGGWGYLIDRAGSGYDIGRDALLRALMAHDGRAEETTVSVILERALSGKPHEMLSEIYAGGRAKIASLAPFILDAAERGDADCAEIVDRSLEAWVGMLKAAYAVIGHSFSVVLGGGIFKNHPFLAIDLAMHLEQPITPIISELPPVYGAFVEAMHAAGRLVTEEMREAFAESYDRLLHKA